MPRGNQNAAVVKYQFEIDDEDWQAWKNTVPRTKSLDERIRELIEADTEGRVSAASEEHSAGERSPTEDASTVSQAGVSSTQRDALRDELAGSGDLLEERVDAIVAMYNRLRERGTAKKHELLDVVDVDATGYASRDSVWSNMVKGKETLSTLPGVETPPVGRTKWRYRDG